MTAPQFGFLCATILLLITIVISYQANYAKIDPAGERLAKFVEDTNAKH